MELSTGVLLGLAAATCWGLTDFFVAVFARRFGPVKVLCIMTIAALVLYVAVWLLVGNPIDYPMRDWLVLLGMSIITTGTYIAFYKGLELGPVAIVAPVVAAYAAVVVVLSMIFLGERLTVIQAIGAAAAMVGVVLASADLRSLPKGASRFGFGVILAILALFGFGTTTFLGGFMAQRYDFIGPTLVGRVMLTLAFFGVAYLRKDLPSGVGRRSWAWILLLGTMESAGYLAFAKGAELGLVSVVAIATATYPVIPLLLGITVLKEKIAPNQWVGIAGVLGGVGMLSWS